jgi:hypothetical protein
VSPDAWARLASLAMAGLWLLVAGLILARAWGAWPLLILATVITLGGS